MDLIEAGPGRRRTLPPAAVGVALVLLGAGQAGAVARTPPLPSDVGVGAPKEAFGFSAEGDTRTVTFQLRNEGRRSVRVLDVGAAVPGLELVDAVASGSPVGFRAVGAGTEPLPRFELRPGDVALMSLTYRLTSCTDVPRGAQPVAVQLAAGRSRGVVSVPLPQLPDDAEAAQDADVVEWQRVLVRDLCG